MSASSKDPIVETAGNDDPYLWLEDIAGEPSLAWVAQQNAATLKELGASEEFEQLRQRLLDILDSPARIPHVAKYGEYFYNFWRDAEHVRGVWRRTTLDEYKKAEPMWEPVLDLDALAQTENQNWVWKGYDVLRPSCDRALVFLSRGGADAAVAREFDLEKKAFVAAGFVLPEAKSVTAWRNRDALLVASDFGPGSLTRSGYPRIVKEWQRHTPLDQAATVFEGRGEDVSVSASVSHDHGRIYELIRRRPAFFTEELHLQRDGAWIRVDKPDDAVFGTFGDHLLLELRSEWKVGSKTYPAGALLAADLGAYLAGDRDLEVLFQPGARKSLAGTSATKSHLIVNELENVRNRLYRLSRQGGRWRREPLPAPPAGSVAAWGIDPDESDSYFLQATDFLIPPSLYLGAADEARLERLKALPQFFSADGLEVGQYEAISADGTRIPYFQVSRMDLRLDGKNPLLLYGYGGFEVALLPSYMPSLGAAWLEKGGVYVSANIRGGGEFGPGWHDAARREKRQRAYEDFIAVAEDVISRRVTSPRHLGIQGGSNGGLLVGVALTQRPELFKAAVCQVPLLDMRRFHKLLAGASWMDEYGDPENPDDWSYIGRYSPYHRVTAGRVYPRVLFLTSTRDDRVHPGHARKMFARMKEQGHDVLYYENVEGGHGGAADNRQAAFMAALAYRFLIEELAA